MKINFNIKHALFKIVYGHRNIMTKRMTINYIKHAKKSYAHAYTKF